LSFFAEVSMPRFDARYPTPPAIPWWVIFAVLGSTNLGCRIFLAHTAWTLVPSLLIKCWAIYLCMFIRQLDAKATSIYWAFGSWFSDGILIFLTLLPERTSTVNLGTVIWSLLAFVSSIVTIYVIRHELMKHYREVEPFGLDLGGVMTFFFSYIYFQYHLCDIAESKRSETATLTT